MDNQYYTKFINEDIDSMILHVPQKEMDFEDHFWHMACLSVYYRMQNDEYMERQCLNKMADMNMAYSTIGYLDYSKCLPLGYFKYLKKFDNPMKNDTLEKRIAELNHKDKKKKFWSYFIYAASGLVVIPLMLLLMVVFKLDSTFSVIIAIVFLVGVQFLLNPTTRQYRKAKKGMETRVVESELAKYFDYYKRFDRLMTNPKVIAFIKEKDKEKMKKMAEELKRTRI